MKNNCCGINYKWIIIKTQTIILKIKSNYATKSKLAHTTDIDTSDLAAKKDFIASKAEVDKLSINKLVNVPTGLNNLKTKVDALDVGKLKSVPKHLKKLIDIIYNQNIKNTKFKKLKTEANNLEKKIRVATTLIHLNQYNTSRQNLEKKTGDVDKKYHTQMV